MPSPTITYTDLANGATAYNANLNALIATHQDLSWVPRDGNYSGNQQNDAWLKTEALVQTYPSLAAAAPGVDFSDPNQQNSTNAGFASSILAAARTATGSNTDVDKVNFVAGTDDAAAETHDLNRAVDRHDGNLSGMIADNEAYASAALSNYFSTGHAYSLGASVFIGLVSSAFDVVNFVYSTAESAFMGFIHFIEGIFSSHNATTAQEQTESTDTGTATTNMNNAGETDAGDWGAFGHATMESDWGLNS